MKAAMYAFAAFATIASIRPSLLQADTQSDRNSLVGSWVQSGGSGGWKITSTAAGLHLTQTEGSAVVADFECNLDGQDCQVKISGHKAKVSLYFNGPSLVEMETKGSDVVKRRFSVVSSGQSMTVEVTPMTGHGQTEELQFSRQLP